MADKKVDWSNLRHVIEQGVVQAAFDAGVTRVVVQVSIDTIVVPMSDGTIGALPRVHIEVTELTPEAAAELRRMASEDKGGN